MTSTLFSSFIEPPFDQVLINNQNIGQNIIQPYLATQIQDTPPVYVVNGTILAIYPSIDNRISYSNVSTVFWVNVTDYEDDPDPVYTHPHDPECDFGAMDETDLAFNTYVEDIKAKVEFRNISVTIQDPPMYFDVPFTRSELTESENDSLSINITGKFDFIYDRNYTYWTYENLPGGSLGCVVRTVADQEIITKQFSSVAGYLVEGEKKIQILEAPIVGIQWFRNNKFNNVLLTNAKLNNIEIKLNNNQIANARLKDFDILTEQFGVQRTISIENKTLNNLTLSEVEVNTTPIPFEYENKTFYYLYEINTSYKGIGSNSLELIVKEDFGQEIKYRDSLSSKAIEGEVIDQDLWLKQKYENNSIEITVVQIGMLGFLIILIARKGILN